MAEEQQQQPTAQEISEPQVSQVTSQTPTTRPAKNPKRVAAGKMVAERTRLAKEKQKKALAEASAIIAREKQKKSAPAPEPVPETAPEPAAADSKVLNGLSTTQWISIIGIGATLVTTYVKREDIKTFLRKERATAPAPAPAPEPKKGLRLMDPLTKNES